MSKLTKAQMHCLEVIAAARHEPNSAWLHTAGVNGATAWGLERRALLSVTRYADGVHFAITEAGRLALSKEGEAS